MGLVSIFINAKTLKFQPWLHEQISRDFLFEMPMLGPDHGPAIILGATRATAFVAAAAAESGHKKFVIVGGKPVNEELPALTEFLVPRIEAAGLDLPERPDMPEHEYAEQILLKKGVAAENIVTFKDDMSTNMGGNMMELMCSFFHKNASSEIFTLAGTARRAIGTARARWDSQAPISAHNVFPTGINRENWADEMPSRVYMLSEADKLPGYIRKGFCRAVNIAREIAIVENHRRGPAPPSNGFYNIR